MDNEALLAELRLIRGLLEKGATQTRHLYPLKEAAFQLGIGLTKMREMVRTGEVLTRSIGDKPMVPRSELERLSTVGAPTPPARRGKPSPKPSTGTQDKAALRALLRKL